MPRLLLISAFLTGIPVSLAMNNLRHQYAGVVSWMWGISSAFNALGALAFVPLAQNFGIAFMFQVVAVCYLVAVIALASGLIWTTSPKLPSPLTS